MIVVMKIGSMVWLVYMIIVRLSCTPKADGWHDLVDVDASCAEGDWYTEVMIWINMDAPCDEVAPWFG